jgi:hypothetical protein
VPSQTQIATNLFNDSGFAGEAWSDPASVVLTGADFASCALNGGGDNSNLLICYSWGFTIPYGAVIVGFSVSADVAYDALDAPAAFYFDMRLGGVTAGSKSISVPNQGLTPVSVGAADDAWGFPPPPITPAVINADNFGLELVVFSTSALASEFKINSLSMTVTYTVSPPPPPPPPPPLPIRQDYAQPGSGAGSGRSMASVGGGVRGGG